MVVEQASHMILGETTVLSCSSCSVRYSMCDEINFSSCNTSWRKPVHVTDCSRTLQIGVLSTVIISAASRIAKVLFPKCAL